MLAELELAEAAEKQAILDQQAEFERNQALKEAAVAAIQAKSREEKQCLTKN